MYEHVCSSLCYCCDHTASPSPCQLISVLKYWIFIRKWSLFLSELETQEIFNILYSSYCELWSFPGQYFAHSWTNYTYLMFFRICSSCLFYCQYSIYASWLTERAFFFILFLYYVNCYAPICESKFLVCGRNKRRLWERQMYDFGQSK